jgi:hypothetical protein
MKQSIAAIQGDAVGQFHRWPMECGSSSAACHSRPVFTLWRLSDRRRKLRRDERVPGHVLLTDGFISNPR